jgi:hypothetical protein
MAGNPLARTTLDATLGQLATRFVGLVSAGRSFNAYIESVTDPQLADAGYTADEIFLIRQFAKAGNALALLSEGQEVGVAMAELGGTLPYPFMQYVIPLTGGQVA